MGPYYQRFVSVDFVQTLLGLSAVLLYPSLLRLAAKSSLYPDHRGPLQQQPSRASSEVLPVDMGFLESSN